MDTALILAGGQSRRFGRPKSLLDIGGMPMIRRVADVMVTLAHEILVSVANAEMEATLQSVVPEAAFVVDRRGGQGPIEGFRCGFEAAQGDRVLVAPCDAPLLRPGLYRLLLETLGTKDVAVPKFDVLDPVRAVYRRPAAMRVLTSAQPGVVSPSSLVDRLRCRFIGPDQIRAVDPELDSFVDVNTQADLDVVLAKMEPRHGTRRHR